MKKIILKNLLALAILFATGLSFMGCAHLAPGADPLVVNTERLETDATATFDLILHVEDENDAFFSEKLPKFVDFCEWLRTPVLLEYPYDSTNQYPRCIAMVKSVDNVKVAYRSGRADSNTVSILSSTLSAAFKEATTWSLSISTNALPVAPDAPAR